MKQAALLALGVLVAVALWAMLGCGSSTANKACTTCTFLYAGNTGSPASMAGFFSFSGSLTILGESPFSTGGAATRGLAVVNNSFLYGAVPAASGGGGIVMMPIQSGTGTSNGVTASAGTSGSLGTPKMFAAGHNFNGLAAAPNGKFLYATDVTSNQVFAYSIDSTGSLAAIPPAGGISVGPDPFNLHTDAAGKFLFVASCDCTSPHSPSQGKVWVFSINNDGTLAAPGASFPLGAAHPADVAPSPDGTLLYIADAATFSGANADQILTESIDSNTGALSPSAPAKALTPVAGGGSSFCTSAPPIRCGSVVITPDAHFIFIADSGIGEVSGLSVGAAITAFSIASNVVTLFASNSFSAGDTVKISGLSGATYLNGQTFTVLSSGLSSSQFQINFTHADVTKTTDAGFAAPPNGAITFLANTSTGGSPATALVLPAGGFLYVTDFDHGTVLAFTIGTNGLLTSSGTLNTGGINPFGLAMTH